MEDLQELAVDGWDVVQKPVNHRGEPGGGRECWRLPSKLKLTQDFAAVTAVHATVQH